MAMMNHVPAGSGLNKSLEPNPRTVMAVAGQLPRQPLVGLNITRSAEL